MRRQSYVALYGEQQKVPHLNGIGNGTLCIRANFLGRIRARFVSRTFCAHGAQFLGNQTINPTYAAGFRERVGGRAGRELRASVIICMHLTLCGV